MKLEAAKRQAKEREEMDAYFSSDPKYGKLPAGLRKEAYTTDQKQAGKLADEKRKQEWELWLEGVKSELGLDADITLEQYKRWGTTGQPPAGTPQPPSSAPQPPAGSPQARPPMGANQPPMSANQLPKVQPPGQFSAPLPSLNGVDIPTQNKMRLQQQTEQYKLDREQRELDAMLKNNMGKDLTSIETFEQKKSTINSAVTNIKNRLKKSGTFDPDEKAIEADEGKFGNWATGTLGQGMKYIGGTDAHYVKKQLDTIFANLGFDTLQEMRDASKTGGALGQVSERELALLIAAKEAIDQGFLSGDLVDSLDALLKQYDESGNRLRQNFETNYSEGSDWRGSYYDRFRGARSFDKMSDEELEAYISGGG